MEPAAVCSKIPQGDSNAQQRASHTDLGERQVVPAKFKWMAQLGSRQETESTLFHMIGLEWTDYFWGWGLQRLTMEGSCYQL